MHPASPAPESAPQPAYGRVGRLYRWLEYAAFGRTLQRSRELFLGQLRDRREIVIFGAGDGRCFGPLLEAAPEARITSIDVDPAFVSLAQAQVRTLPGASRVSFLLLDARDWRADPGRFDAVVTQYFLDCFDEPDLRRVVRNIAESLGPGGVWLYSDFNIPGEPRWARWRARAWIFVLCTFFRWRADHPLRTLPPMREVLAETGLVELMSAELSHGLVRAALMRGRR